MDKREIARRSDALYYSGSDGINRRWLCDKVAELEHELDQLREQERDADHEESVAWDRVRKVERENAKLRKLARDYLIFYSQPGCTCCFCRDECRESDVPCMAFGLLVDRTNELGIEVD
jgi:hypothetical protein